MFAAVLCVSFLVSVAADGSKYPSYDSSSSGSFKDRISNKVTRVDTGFSRMSIECCRVRFRNAYCHTSPVLGCVKLTPGYHTTLRYDRDPLTDGTYPTSTKVVASCNDGLDIIYGWFELFLKNGFCTERWSYFLRSTEATCNNGSWDAQLGRCPCKWNVAQLAKLLLETDYQNREINGKTLYKLK